jgi:hypothetical protein
LEKLISDTSLRQEMGNMGQHRVLKTYSLEAFEEKIKNHLWQHLKRN